MRRPTDPIDDERGAGIHQGAGPALCPGASSQLVQRDLDQLLVAGGGGLHLAPGPR